MAYAKKGGKPKTTKEEKEKVIEQSQEKVNNHLLEIADKVMETFFEDYNKNDIKPWEAPCFNSIFNNPVTGTHYNFINQILLYMASKNKGFTSKKFVTAKQGFENGLSMEKGTQKCNYIIQHYGVPVMPVFERDDSGNIKKDSKGQNIIKRDENGKPQYIMRRQSKLVPLFNIEQFTGEIPAKWLKDETVHVESVNEEFLVAVRDAIVKYSESNIVRAGEDLLFGGANYYSSSSDNVVLYDSKKYKNTLNEIYVMLHEIGHSTGHESRLKRESLEKYAEKIDGYAFYRGYEELVANFTAQAICKEIGISSEDYNEIFEQNNISYDHGWAKNIYNVDPMAMFNVLLDAEKAFNRINRTIIKGMRNEPLLKEHFELLDQQRKVHLENEEGVDNDNEESNKVSPKKKRSYKR